MRNPTTAWAEVTIDCRDPAVLARFWSGLLRVQVAEPPLPGWARTTPTVAGGPVLNFQPVPEPKQGKSRLHLDLWTDDLAFTVRWITQHGGSFTGEGHVYDEGTVAVMADPEGTEFCVVGPAGSPRPT
ncbi:MAG TPA: VOC family protein [Acidimicrobiales bacterium]|nr:VOC family protein [Acidimicrobiales bacterium]